MKGVNPLQIPEGPGSLLPWAGGGNVIAPSEANAIQGGSSQTFIFKFPLPLFNETTRKDSSTNPKFDTNVPWKKLSTSVAPIFPVGSVFS